MLKLFSVFRLFRYYRSNDYKIGFRSLHKSKKCINSAKGFDKQNINLEYCSPKKLSRLCDKVGMPTDTTFSTKKGVRFGLGFVNPVCVPSISIDKSKIEQSKPNLYEIIYEATKRLQKKRSFFREYDKCQSADYTLVHFPFFAGRVTLKLGPLDEYANTMWWQGKYRDLALYLCGNVKNLLSAGDDYSTEGYLWDPSSDEASRVFFRAVSDMLEDEEDISKIQNIANFGNRRIEDILDAINDGTRRGYDQGFRYGWRTALIRCDYVSREDGVTKIFGSPIWISSPCRDALDSNQFGYGWYNLGEYRGKKVFAEWDGKWTGKYGIEGNRARTYQVKILPTTNFPKRIDGYYVEKKGDMYFIEVYSEKDLVQSKEILSSLSQPPDVPSLNHMEATWLTKKFFCQI